VDFGGGTGTFTARLARAAGILTDEHDAAGSEAVWNNEGPLVLCVDPCVGGGGANFPRRIPKVGTL
jgi:hypothetical protein